MECLEAKALKSSFLLELAMESSPQQEISEEVWSVNGGNAVSGEDFEVDEFFNFSIGDLEHDDHDSDSSEERVEGDGSTNSNQSGGFFAVDGSGCLLSGELAIPGDAVADLEWVSHFVDDSCSEFTFPFPVVKVKTDTSPQNRLPGGGIFCFPSSVPARPRTKRPRQSRPAGSPDSSPNQSPASSSSTTSSGISSAPLFFMSADVDSFKPAKKHRKTALDGGSGGSPAQFQRRCSHCLVQKTPQWRTGPNGAKTLCNACGVRYKSGRLFPEYRPAISPTFSSDVHSNSHRKVLEMRRMKDVEEPASGLTQMVQSY